MFFQRDYILRMIEMMGDIMRRIREMMNDLARMKLLEDVCRDHCGLPLETAEALTARSLHELLQPMPRLMMSEILYAKATTFTLPLDERDALLYKSLCLLASLWEEGPLCELRADRLLEMKEAAFPFLTGGELLDCARFLMEGERYADMEDALFQAVEQARAEGEGVPWMADTGVDMLTRAASAPPEALAFARTTREELLASAREMRDIAEQLSGVD